MGIAGGLLALILAGGFLYENILKPRAVLASVDGEEIRRREYWQVRSVTLVEQANQLEQIAQLVGPDQQQQYLQQASQARQELVEVWGSTGVDEPTLQAMIDDRVYLRNLDDLGLEVTAGEVETYALNQFAPADAPLVAPTPSPTLIPARAEMATQTAVARTATATAATPSPVPTSADIPLPPGAPSPPAAVAAATVTPPPATPAAPPPATPAASPAATPDAEQARATAEAGYARFGDDVLGIARLDRDGYERLIARPRVAREKVDAALTAEVGQSAEQVHAAHILVETRDLAQQLADQARGGADFAQLAREQSTDEGTGANGGDLGWFAREEMVPPFAEAAFALPPGQIGDPVETEFGWHVIQVIEHAPNRPLTDQQIDTIERARVARWLEERRAEADVSSDEIAPTEPAAETFQPPVEAPPAPTPAPQPDPALAPPATPVAP